MDPSTSSVRDYQQIFAFNKFLDLADIGHIKILKKAKEVGDFLIVGIHDDDTINKHKGSNYPVLNLQERVLNVLAIKVKQAPITFVILITIIMCCSTLTRSSSARLGSFPTT
jgi:cytidyltransferase-like protein